jgi:hypothetical protein
LKDFADENGSGGNVEDPIGQGLGVYRETGKEIWGAIEGVVKRLKHADLYDDLAQIERNLTDIKKQKIEQADRVVYALGEIDDDYVGVVGGKSAKLGEILNVVREKGGYVPEGLAVATNAFDRFLKESGLENDFSRLTAELDKVLNNPSMSAGERRKVIRNYSEKARALIQSGTLTKNTGLGKFILDVLDGHGLRKEYLAVRSSAVQEDTQEAAFAGAAETYLYVNRDNLLEKIKENWMSFWLPRGIEYRAEQGIQQAEVKPAVTVQKMANADTAGVIFTVNPVNGRNEVVINSSYGLGEAVVSGLVQADMYVSRKSDGEELEFPFIGSKRVKVVRKKISIGTEEVPVQKSDRNKRCLTNEQVKKLTGIAVALEEYFGYPLDIEFAVSEGRIAVLQARPVTTNRHEVTRQGNVGEDIMSALSQAVMGGKTTVDMTRWMAHLADAIQEPLVSAAAKILGPLAQRGVVMVADSQASYETMLAQAKLQAAMGVPVTIMTSFAPAIEGMAIKTSIAGKRVTSVNGSKNYVSTELTSAELPVKNGGKVTIIVTENLALGANVLIEEANDNGILQDKLSTTLGEDQKAWAIVTPINSRLKGSIEAIKGASQSGVIVHEWDGLTKPAETLLEMKSAHELVNNALQSRLAELLRNRKQPVVEGRELSLSPLSLPNDGVAGTYSDMEYLHTLGVSAVFMQDADNIAAVDMLKLIDVLATNGTISKEDYAGFAQDAKTAMHPSDSTATNTVSKDRIEQLQRAYSLIAKDIVSKANKTGRPVMLGKTQFNDGDALLKASAMQQLHQKAMEMLTPDGGGIIVGRVLDKDASASQIIDALANVPAVRFTAKTTSVEEAKTQFGEIVAARRAEQLKKDNRIGKEPMIVAAISAQDPNLNEIAALAVQSGFKVHIIINDAADITGKGNVMNAISATNAAVDVKDKEAAKAAKAAGTIPAFVADLQPSVNGDIPRLNNASRNDIDLIEGILGFAKDAFVKTPEGKYNAGASDGVRECNNMDETTANEYLANVANKNALEDARAHAADNLDTMKVYGKLNTMAGIAMLIAYKKGDISKDDLAKNISLINLLGEAYMKGVSLKELSRDVNDKAGEPTTGEVADKIAGLRLMMASANAAEVANVIITEELHPAQTLGADRSPEYLSLLGRIGLGFVDQKKPDLSEQARRATEANVRLAASILKAG